MHNGLPAPAKPVAQGRLKRLYLGLIVALVAASAPSLLFCGLEAVLALHGHWSWSAVQHHAPAENGWDRLLGMDALAYGWVAEWNRAVTLLGSLFLVASLVVRPWRALLRFALLPYRVIVAADLILRRRYHSNL